MCVELKIKLKSLSEESKIIRKEENKRKGNWAYKALSLWSHRVNYLRPIIRSTHIAYGLVRGLKYHEIENNSKSVPDWKAVKKMIVKYGNKDSLEAIDEIIDNQSYLKAA